MCVYGPSKIFDGRVSKKKKYTHNCSKYNINEFSSGGNLGELCRIRNGVCSNVCDGLIKNHCKNHRMLMVATTRLIRYQISIILTMDVNP